MQNKVRNRIIAVVAALLVAVAAFLAGFFVHRAAVNDWVINTVANNYYKPLTKSQLKNLTPQEIIQKYLDKFCAYYTGEEYAAVQQSNAGAKKGVGFSYTFVRGGIFLNTVMGNSPAYNAGLRAGDTLVSGSVGGKKKVFSKVDDLSDLINSASDGEDIVLEKTDGVSVTVKKAEYSASYVSMATNSSAWTFTGDKNLSLTEIEEDRREYLPENAAYIRLEQFYGDGTAEHFGKLIEVFNEKDCDTLILDLRSDGGGYVNLMSALSGFFLAPVTNIKSAVTMKAQYRDSTENFGVFDGKYKINYTESNCVPAGTAVYVLANSGTASASEALIGTLISYNVTKYENVYISDYSEGEYFDWLKEHNSEYLAKNGKTYGKGIMQTTYLNRGLGYIKEAFKLTTAQIYWQNGVTIHGKGLSAQMGCKTVFADWVITRDDSELKRVVKDIYGN